MGAEASVRPRKALAPEEAHQPPTESEGVSGDAEPRTEAYCPDSVMWINMLFESCNYVVTLLDYSMVN